MTRFTPAWATLTVLFCVSAGPKNVATTRPDKEAIVGTWRYVSVLDQGREMPMPDGNRVVITSDLMTQVYPKDDPMGWKYTIDSSKNPKQMDWLIEETPGQTILNPAIYTLEGDMLKIASAAQDKPRPANFESKKGDFGGVWLLKRVVPTTPNEAPKKAGEK